MDLAPYAMRTFMVTLFTILCTGLGFGIFGVILFQRYKMKKAESEDRQKKMKVDAPMEKNRVHSMANRLFHRDLARERPQLFKTILTFNRSIHARTTEHEFFSRLDSGARPGLSMTGSGFNHGSSMAGINKILNGFNRAKARLFVNNDSLGFWDFEEESRRMALLDAETLNQLILSWGAAFCSPAAQPDYSKAGGGVSGQGSWQTLY